MKIKSKLILGASIIVWIISSVALFIFFDEIGISTTSYSGTSYSDEENMSYTGIYTFIVGIMIAIEVHSQLSGESSNNSITYRATWSHWFFGSTAWVVIIYLIELINIRPLFIELLIEAVVSLALIFYLYKRWVSATKHLL
jgi:hypothetical protein